MRSRPVATLTALVLGAAVLACGQSPEAARAAAPRIAALSSNGVNATMTVDSWGGGYCANITLANTSTAQVTSWTLVAAMNGTTLNNIWGGTGTASGGQLTIKPADYNAQIAPGASQTLGFCGTGSGQPALSTLDVVGGSTNPTTFALTVSKGGQGSGAVASTPAGISCGSTCTASFNSGTVVTLAATPDSGSTFTGWSGACSGTGTCAVTMSAAQSVQASFGTGPTSYTVTVMKAGTGSGTVTSSAGGISCGATCSGTFASGASLTLTAAADSSSALTGWSSTCPGFASGTLTVSASCTVTATFDLTGDPGTAVSVDAGGAASGTFVADAYYSGGSTYSTTSAIDTAQLTGTAPAQAVLQTERYGEFTYTIPNRTPGSAQTVTLYFAESYWTAAGQRTFDVAVNGSAVLTAFDIYAAAGGQNKAIARTFNTTASSAGQVVIAFTKGGGPDNPKVCGITVAGGSVQTYSLTVASGAGGSTSPAPGTYAYVAGSSVAVTALPSSGYAFAGWSGAATGTANPVSVTVDANKTLTASFTPVATPPSTQRQAYDGARGQSFNDGWRFIRSDPSGAQQPSFNDGSWRSLSVPHDWSIELAFNRSSAAGAGGGYLDGGVGWYRKSFTLDSSYAGKRILVGFDGVYMNSQVWINGTSLGTRPYGYSTFQYDLTPYVKTDGSTNVIAVRVNNNQPNSRWYSGSGIYRNVWLTALDPVHVSYNGVYVTTPSVSAGSGSVNVATEVENKGSASQTVTVRTGIYDPSGNLVTTATSGNTGVSANGKSTVTQSLTVSSPLLWSPASPNLYQVKVEVQVAGTTVDTYVSPLGFRWFSFSNTGGMSFNGGYMKMRGTCNHHDLGALGAAFNTRAMERQLQILKSMGVNALRTSHNPPAPELLELADRLGFVVMDEAFDCWESGKTANDYHLYFGQWAQTDLQDFVRRDRNHPSVIMWSIGNEIGNPSVATGTNLRNWARAVDSTRPVTWNNMDVLGSTGSQVASILDLQGFSYNSWQFDAGHSQHPDWKIFGSESSSAVRSRGIYKTPTSTNILSGSDNQCSSYDNSVVSWGASAENAYKDDNNRTWILGEFIWTGFDYIGEPTPYSWPAKSSYFGIVDSAGIPKDIFYFYQSKWTSQPMVHLLPHWNWSSGTTVPVWAYSNCDSVELFLNNASQGSKNVSSSTMHLEWNVPWSSGTLRADCKKGGAVVASDTVRTAGQASQVKLAADRSTLNADGRDLVYVTATIQDSSGVPVPTASNTVTFSVSGPGKIVGVDNGNAIDTTTYTSPTRNAFSGKVVAIVQSTGAPGTITVSATSSGLAAGSASTTAR